ncbi:MAG: superoxide dismutase [Desulfobacterales bacterium]|nr:superoxide dismutase [Desulfobacterales bacterium]
MDTPKLYLLPKLAYDYNALAPVISEDLLRLHHDKHHAAYVNGANAILQKMDKAKADNADFDTKATFKELSFHIGGHLLHSLFWQNLAPEGKGGGEKPLKTIAKVIDEEFGSFDRFKKLFFQAAISTEGSGWAALTFCRGTSRPIIMQVEKHNTNVYPMFRILMVLDVWEHAYYLDYKNDRGKFVEAFWNIVNWTEVNKRLEDILKS